MYLSIKDGSAFLPLMEALPGGVREKLSSLYNFVENSILFPLRMVESPQEADEEFKELYPKYERIRITVNTLLLDSLGEKSYDDIQKGIQGELKDLPRVDILSSRSREKMMKSHKEAIQISNLLVDAGVNTENLSIENDTLEGFPNSRQEDFSELTKSIGKWELGIMVASSAVINEQGEREVLGHYINKSQEFIEEARVKVNKLVRDCAYCSKPFLIRRTNQKYCSKTCLNKARNKRYREGDNQRVS